MQVNEGGFQEAGEKIKKPHSTKVGVTISITLWLLNVRHPRCNNKTSILEIIFRYKRSLNKKGKK